MAEVMRTRFTMFASQKQEHSRRASLRARIHSAKDDRRLRAVRRARQNSVVLAAPAFPIAQFSKPSKQVGLPLRARVLDDDKAGQESGGSIRQEWGEGLILDALDVDLECIDVADCSLVQNGHEGPGGDGDA